jgi:hypothetical protein
VNRRIGRIGAGASHDPGKKGVLPIREAYEFMLFHQFIKGVTLCRTQVKEIGVWSLYD